MTQRKVVFYGILDESYFKLTQPFLTYFNNYMEESYLDIKDFFQTFFTAFQVSIENKLTRMSWKFTYGDFSKNNNNTTMKPNESDSFDNSISKDLSTLEISLSDTINDSIGSISSSFAWFKSVLNCFAKQILSILTNEFKGISSKYTKLVIDKNTKYKVLMQEKIRVEETLQNTEELLVAESQSNKELKYKLEEMERKYNALVIEKNNNQEIYNKKIKELHFKNNELEESILKLKREMRDLDKEDIVEIGKEKRRESFLGSTNNIGLNNSTNTNLTSQDTLRTLQALYLDFKECTDKLDSQKDVIFSTSLIQEANKVEQNQQIKWLEEIKSIVENQLYVIKEGFTNDIKQLNEKLNQEHLTNINMKIQINDRGAQIENLNKIISELTSDNKNMLKEIDIIKETVETQAEANSMQGNRITELERVLENRMMDLSQYKTNYRLLEDEIDTLMIVFEAGLVIFIFFIYFLFRKEIRTSYIIR